MVKTTIMDKQEQDYKTDERRQAWEMSTEHFQKRDMYVAADKSIMKFTKLIEVNDIKIMKLMAANRIIREARGVAQLEMMKEWDKRNPLNPDVYNILQEGKPLSAGPLNSTIATYTSGKAPVNVVRIPQLEK
jgi:hypothetical protein